MLFLTSSPKKFFLIINRIYTREEKKNCHSKSTLGIMGINANIFEYFRQQCECSQLQPFLHIMLFWRSPL